MSVEVNRVVVGRIATNCYLVTAGDACVVIDPGADAPQILAALAGRTPNFIVVTHGHWDHVGGLADMVAATGAPVAAFDCDRDFLHDREANGMDVNFADVDIPPVDTPLGNGSVVEAGDICLKVLYTPGHTVDSICLYEEAAGLLFAGDTLFAGGDVGRYDLPTGSRRDIVHSCNNVLSRLPDNVIIYPGHGSSSTMAYERAINPLLAVSHRS